jgi:CO/xanthine dehydrogenase Mo-binding subunit
VRFTQGKGNYADDIKLPGMLHGDFHRSSHGHARIVKIDTSKAKALPGGGADSRGSERRQSRLDADSGGRRADSAR